MDSLYVATAAFLAAVCWKEFGRKGRTPMAAVQADETTVGWGKASGGGSHGYFST